jgi:hypothetical protein
MQNDIFFKHLFIALLMIAPCFSSQSTDPIEPLLCISQIAHWYQTTESIQQESPIPSPIPALKAFPEFNSEFCTTKEIPIHCSIAKEFEKSALVWEGYTIEQHTQMVLDRLNLYKESIHLPKQIKMRDFSLFLILHDIGKNMSGEDKDNKDKGLELRYSRRMFKAVARGISMEPSTIKILSRLLHDDTIGNYLKGECAAEATRGSLIKHSQKCELPVLDFFNLHMLFHKLDAGSYQCPHPEKGSLEARLFVPNTLTYKGDAANKIRELQNLIQG